MIDRVVNAVYDVLGYGGSILFWTVVVPPTFAVGVTLLVEAIVR